MLEKICCVCLVSDVKIYNIDNNRLSEIYDKLTDFQQPSEVKPRFVCYICASLLLRCLRLSDTARRSQEYMRTLLMTNQEIPKGAIATLQIKPILTKNAYGPISIQANVITIKDELVTDISQSDSAVELIKVETSNSNECTKTFKTPRELDGHMSVRSVEHTICLEKNHIMSADKTHRTFDLDETHTEGNILDTEKGDINLQDEKHTINSELLSCNTCSVTFRRKKHFKEHLKMNLQKPNLCNLCNTRFAFVYELERHTKKHLDSKKTEKVPETKCHCGKTFPDRSSLLKHNFLCLSKEQQKVRMRKSFRCPKCKQKFPDEAALKNHSIDHEELKRFSCNICHKKFRFSAIMRKHMITHIQNLLDCNICNIAFDSEDALNAHMQEHSNVFNCEKCNIKFAVYTIYTKHIMAIHGQADNPATTEQINSETNIQRNRYKSHICDTCKRGFRTSSHLVIHKRIHTNERPFQCDECEKAFRSLSLLKTHKITHTGEKTCSCEVCGKAFGNKGGLNRHMLVHTGEHPLPCHLCDKAYKQSHLLTQHLHRVHYGIKPFVCELCGSKFVTRRYLKLHMNTHTGLKPYECVKCGVKFTTKSSLGRHMKNCCIT